MRPRRGFKLVWRRALDVKLGRVEAVLALSTVALVATVGIAALVAKGGDK